MNVLVFGKPSGLLRRIRKSFSSYGLKQGGKPQAILCVGGDGTLLLSERRYPGIPKLLVKHSRFCRKCDVHDYHFILSKLSGKKFVVEEWIKIEAVAKGKKLVGLNDVNVHYKLPEALRFSVKLNGKTIEEMVIGDGIVVATPFGSTGYFESIARKNFSKGLGVAFNNPTWEIDPLFVPENSVVEVKVVAGTALVACDNNTKVITLNRGDSVKIRRHSSKAKTIRLLGNELKAKV